MSLARQIARLARLPVRDQGLIAQTVCIVALVRLALSTVGYRRLRHWLPKPNPDLDPAGTNVKRIAQAVSLASKVIPGASCLTQAVAGHVLLARRGKSSLIRIGIRPTSGGRLAAHAWLVLEEGILIGANDEDLTAFTHLTDLGSE
jgi:hypothetical protein